MPLTQGSSGVRKTARCEASGHPTPLTGPAPAPAPAPAGVHKEGLKRRFFKRPDGTVGFDGPATEWDLSACVPLECRAGTLVLLHGENVHYRCVRGANRAPLYKAMRSCTDHALLYS